MIEIQGAVSVICLILAVVNLVIAEMLCDKDHKVTPIDSALVAAYVVSLPSMFAADPAIRAGDPSTFYIVGYSVLALLALFNVFNLIRRLRKK